MGSARGSLTTSPPLQKAETMRTARQNRADNGTQTKLDRIHAESIAIVETGICPQCGEKLRRNNSMTGWWQCRQLGAVGFRKHAERDSCSFQCFTE